MLTLTKDASCDSGVGDVKPPMFIVLERTGTKIGRGYDNDVQLLYPWLSRRHVTISYVDGDHFVESCGQRSALLNGVIAHSATLKEGDTVTLGVSRGVPGTPHRKPSGPHVSYRYSRRVSDEARALGLPQGGATGSSKLISVSEEVNGCWVERTFHEEDFTCTQVSEASEAAATSTAQLLLPQSTASSSVASADSLKVIPSRSSRARKRPARYDDGADKMSSKSKSGASSSSNADDRTANDAKHCKLVDGSCAGDASVKSGRSTSPVKTETESLAPDTAVKSEGVVSPVTECIASSAASSGAGSQRDTKSDDVCRPTLVNTRSRRSASSLIKPQGSHETLVESSSSPRSKKGKCGKKLRGRKSKVGGWHCAPPSKVDSAGCSRDTLDGGPAQTVSCDGMAVTAVKDVEVSAMDVVSSGTSANQSKPAHDGDDDVVYPADQTASSGKRSSKNRRSKPPTYTFGDSDGSDSLPSLDGLIICKSGEGGKKSGADAETDWLTSATLLVKSSELRMGGKGGKGGKGAKLKGKKAAPAKNVITEAQKVVIGGWKRDELKAPKPKLELVLSGYYRKSLYSFTDTSIFQVTYKDGLKTHDWMTGEYDIDLHVDMPSLQYKIHTSQLASTDLDKLLSIVRLQSCKADMGVLDGAHPAAGVGRGAGAFGQPVGLTVMLKQYQLNGLAWMVNLERGSHEWTLPKLLHWKDTSCKMLFDVNNERIFMPPAPPPTPSTILKVTARGGILADEMGLGKTITLLSLVATNVPDIPVIPIAAGFDHRVTCQLACRTTLVVAPSHLTAQWKHEAEVHMPGLSVILITTKPQYEKLSYVDILRADIVIVSVPFLLSNKAFTGQPAGAAAETAFMKLMQTPGINPLLEKPPNLNHFCWWRLICDEGHELLTYEQKYFVKQGYRDLGSPGLLTLSRFVARHRWYVTGTPFPQRGRSLRAALKFLEVTVDDAKLAHPDGSLRVDVRLDAESAHDEFSNSAPLIEFVRDELYVRHTKTSIAEQYDVPEYVEELMLLTMSDVERGVYERSYTELERRQLCCHLQIVSRLQSVVGVQQRSLEQVRVALVEHTRKEITLTQNRIELNEKQIEKETEDLKHESKPALQRMHKAQISRLVSYVRTETEALAKHKSALSYFDSIVPKIVHSADEPCVVCLDNIDSLTVTPCGHLFCRGCIVSCVRQQGCCPTCRGVVTESQLIEVKDASAKDEVDKGREIWKLTEQYGTKMAHLIFYLRHLFRADAKSRVIIFSQWDTMLHKIGSTLLDNSIHNVFVKGNVFVRNKAIMSFRKQENTRVIMLSLENAASGTNLVEATHIILIDPVAGTKEQAQAVEAQAIGRAHRMGQDKQIVVVRMLMQDTIEHELYKRNNSDAINQLEFNFNKPTAFGGPQIMRSVRKVPEPATSHATPVATETAPTSSRAHQSSPIRILNELIAFNSSDDDDDDDDSDDDDDYGLGRFYQSSRKLPALYSSDEDLLDW